MFLINFILWFEVLRDFAERNIEIDSTEGYFNGIGCCFCSVEEGFLW